MTTPSDPPPAIRPPRPPLTPFWKKVVQEVATYCKLGGVGAIGLSFTEMYAEEAANRAAPIEIAILASGGLFFLAVGIYLTGRAEQ